MSKWGFALLSAALIIFLLTMTSCSAKNYETNTYEVKEAFNKILIKTDTADITFLPSDDGKCKVICYEQEKKYHSVEVNNGTLTVKVIDENEWYDYIGINIDIPKITVYLPDALYDSIVIKESTGDICLERVSALSLDITLSTGNVTATDITCEGNVTVGVSTGEVNLCGLKCKNLISTGSTGKISMKNVIATEKISVERSTGDVTLDRSDAAELFIMTSTGDVEGSLLTNKVFITKTDTGRIDVPNSIIGGRCEITTDTGDIKISISED